MMHLAFTTEAEHRPGLGSHSVTFGLPQNNRMAKLLSVHVQQSGNPPSSLSRSCALHHLEAATIAKDVFMVIQSLNMAGNQQEAW